ncbi:MAG: ABC transporter permease [Gammaproteobacteria bacterium]|jgi:microcin C transport system permease protein
MLNLNISPLTLKTLKRFRSVKRGYWSAIIIFTLIILSLVAEVFVNSRALVVSYEGELYFPTYGAIIPGEKLGLGYQYETNYRDLKEMFKKEDSQNWVLLPPFPYNAFETDLVKGFYPPTAPSFTSRHYLGTDTVGRDIVARLVYGFRIAIFFSLFLLVCNYIVGTTIGCLMGYWGGIFDLLFQRLIEIWSNIPFLYVIMIIASIIVPNFWSLLIVMLMFSWMGMTWYMRTATYKEKEREYVMASRALGAGTARIIFHHIIPNTVSIIITFIPFSVAGGITALTSLDFLGFGLPPPTPSWGELLRQGIENLQSPWIVSSIVTSMVLVLTMVTFIGEAIREAYDPKRHTIYE